MATYWKVSPDGKFPLKRKKPFTKHFWILLLWNSSVSCFSRWCIRYGLYIYRKKEKKRTSLNKSSSSSSCFLVGVSQLLPLSSRNCVFFLPVHLPVPELIASSFSESFRERVAPYKRVIIIFSPRPSACCFLWPIVRNESVCVLFFL